MDINLYVTLSECHPLSPIESYQTGVPALMSRTSDVFRSDARLWDLTTVEIPDDPSEIVAAIRRLMEHAEEAIEHAHAWIDIADRGAAERWREFVLRSRVRLQSRGQQRLDCPRSPDVVGAFGSLEPA